MIDKPPQVEIMAPAGSWESFSAAIRAGADSVYFGAGGLNMRNMSSANFSLPDVRKLVGLAKAAGVKSYLTLNTIIYDADMNTLKETLKTAKDSGVDAVIVSDLAALKQAADLGLKIHLSTQLNISNRESLSFFSQWGDVAVLARELNLTQVKALHQTILQDKICGPSGNLLRLEIFVHGALCMAVSGKCHLSLHQYNTSANRGECLQACRRGYGLRDLETGEELTVDNEFLMSPKDLKTIHFLDRILYAGVNVLKIEGRGRKPEYVSETVACYKEAASSVLEGNFTAERVSEWDRRLGSVFNRGFWDGYYLGQRLGEWSGKYGSSSTKRRVLSGVCTNSYPRVGAAEFRLDASNLPGSQEVLITGPTTGALTMTPKELRVNGIEVDSAEQGSLVTFLVDRKVRRGDKLFSLVEVKRDEGEE